MRIFGATQRETRLYAVDLASGKRALLMEWSDSAATAEMPVVPCGAFYWLPE